MEELEARRRELLARCAAQRVDLSQRVGALRAGAPAPRLGRVAGEALRSARHPLTWIAALAGLSMLGRTRDVVKILALLRTALTVASRASQVLALVNQVRTRRSARASAGRA